MSRGTAQMRFGAGERLAALRLIRSRRVGPAGWHRMVGEHGSAEAALAALPQVAAAAGVTDYAPCPEGVALAELRAGERLGARLIVHGEAGYPAALAAESDAPPVLWVRGRADLLARPMVALVGARNASSLGLRMARNLAEGVGQAGFVTVSGMARGIDKAAHEGALAHGTVAVMAGGVDQVYPAENAALFARIAAEGAIVSEQPPGLVAQARHFPQRNRIVAGLSRAVVVVEAALRSGSLITAREAAEIGREVLAVPGHPFDARAGGCNQLLRDGATLIRSTADLLEALGPGLTALERATLAAATPADPGHLAELPGPVPAPRPKGAIRALHQMILEKLTMAPLAEDQLLRDLAASAGDVAPHLLDLELEGQVIRQPGGMLSRAG